jgi:hypothetical protein
MEAVAVPAPEPLLDGAPLALEADLPVGVETHRQDRGGIVGPMFEEVHLVLEQPAQQLRPVALAAREQDHVMSALHGVDAVDPHESDPLDQLEQALGREPAA